MVKTAWIGRTGRRFVTRLFVFVCFAVLAARLYYRRGPECFPQFDRGTVNNINIHDGQQFWVSGESILSQPVTGGPIREIVRENLKKNDQIWDTLTFVNGSIIYSIVPRPQMGSGSVSPGMMLLGTFRAALHTRTSQQTTQERRVVMPMPKSVLVDLWRYCRVSLHGGQPMDLTSKLGGYSLFISGYAYWVKRRLDDSVWITSGNVTWQEVTGHSELIATSLADGSSRTLSTGLSMDTLLMPGQNGVFWTEPRPFPDRRLDLYYYRTGDAKIYRLLDYKGYPNTPPVEYMGRLYWYASENTYPANSMDRLYTHWAFDRLVSANLDGSDQRTVFSLTGMKRDPIFWSYTNIQEFRVYRGNLFCLFREQPSAKISGLETSQYICRLHPDRRDPIEDISVLPSQSRDFVLDGDYLYFSHNEQHRPLLDRLTGDDTHTETIPMLCRIRLPD